MSPMVAMLPWKQRRLGPEKDDRRFFFTPNLNMIGIKRLKSGLGSRPVTCGSLNLNEGRVVTTKYFAHVCV